MRKIETILIALLLLITFSCSKNNENYGIINDEISFTISFSGLSNSLKSVNLNDSFPTLDDAKQIVLTIKSTNGEDTKYNSEKIEIFKMNGKYFSQKLSLVAGDYKLTEFFLIDSSNNTIFATPITGSLQVQNVDRPLPIDFSIAKDQITSVNVEVLATTGLSPADFGLVGFIFHEVPTFSFLINVSEKGQMDSLLTAPIIITNGSYNYSQTVGNIGNDIITIRDGYPDYNLLIAKEGYVPYNVTFSVDSLKQHTEFPLTIELEKEVPETVVDIDGNIYHTIKIGNQVWMVENLKTTKYNDGTNIPNVTEANAWVNLTTPAYCWYNNDTSTYKAKYGALYNWYTVKTGKLAPKGWHVPTAEEWNILTDFLSNNGYSYEGDVTYIAKSMASTTGWLYYGESGTVGNNQSSNNSSGFTACPSGGRTHTIGTFCEDGYIGYWWSSNECNLDDAYLRYIGYTYKHLAFNQANKKIGFSVRCIKD